MFPTKNSKYVYHLVIRRCARLVSRGSGHACLSARNLGVDAPFAIASQGKQGAHARVRQRELTARLTRAPSSIGESGTYRDVQCGITLCLVGYKHIRHSVYLIISMSAKYSFSNIQRRFSFVTGITLQITTSTTTATLEWH